MADPDEGVAADGTIRTGARRSRVPAAFEPVLADAVALAGDGGASLYVYGSVATGTVRYGSSDVDLLSIDLPSLLRHLPRWHHPYRGIRCECPIHAAGTTWLGHPRRMNGGGSGRPGCGRRGHAAAIGRGRGYRPRPRPMISFMISVVPPNMDWTRLSVQARPTAYSRM
jgi:hypothetical protein